MRIALSKKIALLAPLFMFSLLVFAPAVVNAQIVDPSTTGYGLGGPEDQGFRKVGLGQGNDVKGSIANIINIILGFLGIIAVIIILAGGFKWMTAGGNEDKVAESRQMIIQGVIGLVVVFAAWAIASFVVTNLQSATAV